MAATSEYHRFPIHDFQASEHKLEVRIGENAFSGTGIRLDLPGLRGSLQFQGVTPFPFRWYAPGIMHWYSFVPRMECYHGIVSLDHSLHGTLTHRGRKVSFDGGRGYIEKDWGRSFPSSWIWMQTIHFDEPGTSLSASVAKIPWLGSHFIGFIVVFWWKGTLYRFATYTGARLERVFFDDAKVEYTISDKRLRLELRAWHAAGADLVSPVRGVMEGRLKESMKAVVEVKMTRVADGSVLYSGTGRLAGLEVAGNASELLV